MAPAASRQASPRIGATTSKEGPPHAVGLPNGTEALKYPDPRSCLDGKQDLRCVTRGEGFWPSRTSENLGLRVTLPITREHAQREGEETLGIWNPLTGGGVSGFQIPAPLARKEGAHYLE